MENMEVKKEFQVEEKAITRTKDKICIVGCADTKDIVPFNDNSMEFWGVNNLYGVQITGMHYDRWFEIHNIELIDGKYYRRENPEFRGQTVDQYMKGLGKLACPVIYMQKKWDIVPNSVAYPLDLITASFGRYFTNTISYEIALAIYMLKFGTLPPAENPEIIVYGVDMAVGTEYAHQRPSCEYFLGVAAGLGIKVTIPDEADLLKTRFMYGFEERKRSAWAKKTAKLEQTLANKQAAIKTQLDQLTAQYHQYLGCRQGVSEMNKIWSNLDDPIPGGKAS